MLIDNLNNPVQQKKVILSNTGWKYAIVVLLVLKDVSSSLTKMLTFNVQLQVTTSVFLVEMHSLRSLEMSSYFLLLVVLERHSSWLENYSSLLFQHYVFISLIQKLNIFNSVVILLHFSFFIIISYFIYLVCCYCDLLCWYYVHDGLGNGSWYYSYVLLYW